jgi:cell shape-determining protein MreD
MLAEKSISRIVALHLIAILFTIFNISDIKIAGLSKVIPLFDLMMVFYFVVFRNIFALWFIFLLGLWNDALSGSMPGTTSLCYIIVVKFFIILNQKFVIRESFKQIWQQFIAFSFCFLFLKLII